MGSRYIYIYIILYILYTLYILYIYIIYIYILYIYILYIYIWICLRNHQKISRDFHGYVYVDVYACAFLCMYMYYMYIM